MNRLLLAAASIVIIAMIANALAQSPLSIAPADPAIGYSGRFDTRDKAGPRCEWPASAITLKFSGAGLAVRFADTGDNFWQVAIDGAPTAKIETRGSARAYPVATGLAQGEHIVTLTKATESFAGITQFLGFDLTPGSKPLALPAATPARRIEVIGDSISCGYGVEAANQHEHYTPQTQNAWLAYGAIAARALGADYTCIAWSGRKMWPDNTIPELYDLALPTDPKSQWPFTTPAPDAIIINLGTNDFGGKFPDQEQWIAAYRKFIARLRTRYPKAAIYCATGTMLGDGDAYGRNPKSTLLDCVQKIVAAENAAGNANIRALDFGQQNPADGIGGDWHPSRKTHQLMAAKLTAALQKDLAWK